MQKYGNDYEETFTLVTKFTSIRIVLSLAAKYTLTLHQMDVKTAFLNGVLDKDIYMTQPDGYIDADHPNYVQAQTVAIWIEAVIPHVESDH